MIGLMSFKVHVLICGSILVDKDASLELIMFVCRIYKAFLSCSNSLGSFGLTLVWCRCVSQVLGAPLINKCENWGELRGYHLKAGLIDLLLSLKR